MGPLPVRAGCSGGGGWQDPPPPSSAGLGPPAAQQCGAPAPGGALAGAGRAPLGPDQGGELQEELRGRFRELRRRTEDLTSALLAVGSPAAGAAGGAGGTGADLQVEELRNMVADLKARNEELTRQAGQTTAGTVSESASMATMLEDLCRRVETMEHISSGARSRETNATAKRGDDGSRVARPRRSLSSESVFAAKTTGRDKQRIQLDLTGYRDASPVSLSRVNSAESTPGRRSTGRTTVFLDLTEMRTP